MSKRFGFKLGGFAIMAGAVCAATILLGAYVCVQKALLTEMRKHSRVAATLIARGVSDRLESLADRSRYYIASQKPLAFARDGSLIALSVLQKPTQKGVDGDWEASRRWLLPKDADSRIDAVDFKNIDLKYPIDIERVAQGKFDISFASAPRIPAFVRVAIPYGEESGGGYQQAIVAEVRIEEFKNLLSPPGGLATFLIAPSGHVAIASDLGHFDPSEDLKNLPLVKASRMRPQATGSLEYRETEGGDLQLGSYAKLGSFADMVVLAQEPADRASRALLPWLAAAFVGSLAFAYLLGLVIARFAATWAAEELAKKSEPVPEKPQAAPEAPIRTQALAKIADETIRRTLEQSPAKLAGERTDAAVLHAHLHGVDKLSSLAQPDQFIAWLNAFHQKAAQAIESRQGIVDHVHGGSIVAFWGAPLAQKDEVAHAIEAAAAVSEAAHELNEALRKAALPECRIGMGLHYGPLAVGQIGIAGRLEYSAVGEGIEVATLIQQFTDQFGTDFLLTGAAAKRVGETFAVEKLTAGDDGTPELYELSEAA